MQSVSTAQSNSDNAKANRAGSPQVYDLYADLFAGPGTEHRADPQGGLRAAVMTQAAPAPSPRSPATLADSGLTNGQLSDLLLKTLYVHGVLQGTDFCRLLRLPFNIIDEALRGLRDQKLIEVASGDLVGRITYRFALTEVGRVRA